MDETALSQWSSDPVELVYRACYAPVDLESLLSTSETRSRIRRLPAAHLYFGLSDLEARDVERLLPHITEEQWQGVLDLDIWNRDQADPLALAGLQRHLVTAEDPVARKLARALDPDLWQLLWKELVEIEDLTDDALEHHSDVRQTDWVDTPDGFYRIYLPENPEEAKLIRDLILRLYELDAEGTTLSLKESQWRTSTELQEAAYHLRTERLQELGFQDYFDAIEIQSPLFPGARLPEKRLATLKSVEMLPVVIREQAAGNSLLLLEALAAVESPVAVQSLLEELFFVCNRVLSANSGSAASPEEVREGIREAIHGTSFGLEMWSVGSLEKAVAGIQSHYLQSFYRLGLGYFADLQKRAQALLNTPNVSPGSFEEQVLEGLLLRYPRKVEIVDGKIWTGFFAGRAELEEVAQRLSELEKPGDA